MVIFFVFFAIVFLVKLYILNAELPQLPEYDGGFQETFPIRISDAWTVMSHDDGKPWYYLLGAGFFIAISILIGWISYRIVHGVSYENYLEWTFGISVTVLLIVDVFIGFSINNPIFRAAVIICLALATGAITFGYAATQR